LTEQKRVRPIKALLDPYNPIGSTRHVRFNTSRSDRWETNGPPPKNQVNWVVLDSDWEAEFCRVAESHPKVIAYTKNHNLGLEVPYRYGSETRKYLPDFIVLVDDGHGADDPLHLVVEIKGYRREDAKEEKSTMDTYWVRAGRPQQIPAHKRERGGVAGIHCDNELSDCRTTDNFAPQRKRPIAFAPVTGRGILGGVTLELVPDPPPTEVRIARCYYVAPCRARRCSSRGIFVARYLDSMGRFLRQFELCDAHACVWRIADSGEISNSPHTPWTAGRESRDS
jgi:hypothetical protein